MGSDRLLARNRNSRFLLSIVTKMVNCHEAQKARCTMGL